MQQPGETSRSLKTEPCPFWLNASAIVLFKPVICLGHTVICNKNNKDGEQKGNPDILY